MIWSGQEAVAQGCQKQVDVPSLKSKLLKIGIFVEVGSYKGIAGEAPIAYKDVNPPFGVGCAMLLLGKLCVVVFPTGRDFAKSG